MWRVVGLRCRSWGFAVALRHGCCLAFFCWDVRPCNEGSWSPTRHGTTVSLRLGRGALPLPPSSAFYVWMLGGRAWMNGARAHERPDGVAHWMTPSGEFHGATTTRCDLELRCTGSAVRRLLRNGRSTAVPFGAAVSDSGKALRRTQRSGLEGACGGVGPAHIPR